MIDIRLKVFRSVAINRSFTKASQELFISQPAISKHIQELEKEYNVRLFDRMGTHIQLTTAGEKLLTHANKILKDYQRLDVEMNALRQQTTGELRIGASTTIAQYVLPEQIAAFRKRFPDVRISLLSGNSREVEAALISGRIDLGMVEGYFHQPQLKYTPFMDDELVAIVSKTGRYSELETISLEELKQVPIVLREFGSGSLDIMQQALEKGNIRLSDLNIEINLGSTEGIKHYVEHSDCMGVVSIRSVNKEIFGDVFRVVDIEDLKLERTFAFVEKRGEAMEPYEMFKRFITSGYKS